MCQGHGIGAPESLKTLAENRERQLWRLFHRLAAETRKASLPTVVRSNDGIPHCPIGLPSLSQISLCSCDMSD